MGSHRGSPPKNIVFTNNAGIIVGFGETRRGGYPRHGPARRPLSDWDWVGFAGSARLSGTLRAYAIVHGGSACAFGSPQAAPGLRRLSQN